VWEVNPRRRTVEVREDGGDPFLRLHVIAKIEVERLK
jgi:hypothetical protein